MEPAFYEGQRVWAFKTGIGARIYTRFDFRDPQLHAVRLPGLRKVHRDDVVVFNHPYGVFQDTISFRINRVLIKRCRGIPGDTVKINGTLHMYVPGIGDRVLLDTQAFAHYRHQIEFETGGQLNTDERGVFLLNGKQIKEYTFSSNWYFFEGDNLAHSLDSRHFGLVPEKYIIGRVINF